MKATFAAAAAIAAAFGATAASADKLAVPADSLPGGWVYIGTTHAQHMNDHDTLIVAGLNDHFRAIKVRVTDAPLHMQRMRIIYDNGAPEEIPIRFNIRQGGESRTIDLRGGDRAIHQIDFWYDTKGWFKGTANVSVYGMH
jgi:hypothetical protein